LVVLSSWTKTYKSITDPIITMVICDYALLCTVDYKHMLLYTKLYYSDCDDIKYGW
jgi:hypothetical protein